jgi:BlaI family transcriptional regulator, penicillinase repressor
MSPSHPRHLSKRERQIMDVLYGAGRATAADVRARMPDAPSYSAVRTLLHILEEKGHLRHEQDGLRYVYVPTVTPAKAQRSALKHMIDTFFGGSAARGMAALFELSGADLDEDELRRLRRMIDEARKKGK